MTLFRFDICNFSIGTRLTLGYCALLAFLAIPAGLSFYQLRPVP